MEAGKIVLKYLQELGNKSLAVSRGLAIVFLRPLDLSWAKALCLDYLGLGFLVSPQTGRNPMIWGGDWPLICSPFTSHQAVQKYSLPWAVGLLCESMIECNLRFPQALLKMYQDCLFCKNGAVWLWTQCVFNIENLEITLKYGEEYFALSCHPEKIRVHVLFCPGPFSFLFLSLIHISLFTPILTVPPRKAIKKTREMPQSIVTHEPGFHVKRISPVQILQKSFWEKSSKVLSSASPPKFGTTWAENTDCGLGLLDTVGKGGRDNSRPRGCCGPGGAELGTLLTDSLIQETLECLQWWGRTKNMHGSWSQRENHLGRKLRVASRENNLSYDGEPGLTSAGRGVDWQSLI